MKSDDSNSAYKLAQDALTEVFYVKNPYGYEQIIPIIVKYFDIDRPDILTNEQRLLALSIAEALEITSGGNIAGFVPLAKGLIQLGMELQHDGHGTLAKKSNLGAEPTG